MLAHAQRHALQFGLAALGIDHDMAELVGERDEIALGIDDCLLHQWRALLQQAA